MGVSRSCHTVILLCLLAGCSGKAPTGQQVQDKVEASIEDQSLTTEEYVKRGVPSPAETWQPDQTRAAYEALSAIAIKNPEQLPRYESKRSGKVFAALTSNACLASLKDKSQPIDQRFPAGLTHFESLNQMLKIYFMAMAQGRASPRELVEVQGAQIEAAAAMTSLTNEFLVTLDPADPKYPVRLRGLKKSRISMANMVNGTLISLTENRPKERNRLFERVKGSIPRLVAFLEPAHRQQILDQIKALSTDSRMGSLRPQLAELYETTQEEVKAAAESPINAADTTKIQPKPAFPDGKAPEFHGIQIGQADANGLYPARSTKGRFSVVFPGPYNDFSMSEKDQGGGPVEIHALGTKTMLNVKYVAVRTSSADAKKKTIDDLKSVPAEMGKGKTREMVFQGFPALELRAKKDKVSIASRFILADGDLFMVSVEYPAHLQEKLKEEIDRFLNSLKIDASASPPVDHKKE